MQSAILTVFGIWLITLNLQARAETHLPTGFEVPQIHEFWAFDDRNQVINFLVDPKYVSSISEMDAQHLKAGQSPKAPWSDSFWPTQKGLIARRWMDGGFPNSKSFMDNYDYVQASPPLSIPLNNMAPSEKYDYLVGDMDFHLTAANWAEGKASYDKIGTVPGWAGICHGWAPASILTPAPKKSVIVTAYNGTPITFYPSDIKALISLAYASSPPKMHTTGTRCNVSHPKENPAGRVIDPRCYDINPGTWHLAIVNEMGVNKRSFVADTNYDLQIWNYPLYSYHYQYFNPQTFQSSTELAGSIVPMSEFTVDKYKTFRGPDAKFVVGVEMDISFSIETQPSQVPFQNPKLTTEKILYDLELDDKGTIIGGEWYSNFHPAFIWRFDPDAQPLSDGEISLAAPLTWDGKTPVSDAVHQLAIESSAKEQPLALVVETLVRLSQEPDIP